MRRRSHAAGVALAIPAAAFAGVVRFRNAWYDRPGASRRASVPVISVGNLAVGGTGKGADTVMIIKSASSRRFLDLKVLEIVAKPRSG